MPPRRQLAADGEKRGRILGVLRTWGNVIPGDHGCRAEYAAIAALLVIAGDFTVSREQLEIAAAAYGVPLLVPHTAEAEAWRARLDAIKSGLPDPLAGDLDEEWRQLAKGGAA
jgi:hypothetical protein